MIELAAYHREHNIVPAVYVEDLEVEEEQSEPSDFINDEIWNMGQSWKRRLTSNLKFGPQ